MTLTTTTTYTITCDGTVRAACTSAHPDTPHTCDRTLTGPSTHAIIQDALTFGWEVTIPDGDPAQARTYCPLHRDQAKP